MGRLLRRLARLGAGGYAVIERDFLVTTSTRRFLAVRLVVAAVAAVVVALTALANHREPPDEVGRFVLGALAEAEDPAIQEASQVVLPYLLELRQKFDPEAYGGAHLVGVKGTVVIAHGSSSRVAIANALALAPEGAERGLVGRIEAGLGG